MSSRKPTEWVAERIGMMKARCADLRVQGDDGTMFEPYTEDIVRFFDRFGGKRHTPNLFLDPHEGFAGIPGWDGPPTILVPMVYGNEAVGSFLHEAGHWECWFERHPCRPARRGVEVINFVENEECAETYALRALLALGDAECIRLRLVLVCLAYHTAPLQEQRQAFWNVRHSTSWAQCEARAQGWKEDSAELLARNGLAFIG